VKTLSKITAVGLIFVWGLLLFQSLKNFLNPLILRGGHLEFVSSISGENNFFAVQTAFN